MMRTPAPLTPTALRTRWALLDLTRGGGASTATAGRRIARGVAAMGLHFPSPVALAAGFDRCGVLVGRAAGIGLGAVEIGSVSAGSQALQRIANRLRRHAGTGTIHGVSLLKRQTTPWPRAADELAGVLRQMHGLADYCAVNPGRDCRDPAVFANVVEELACERDRLAGRGPRTPLVAKLPARWLATSDPTALAAAFAERGADGLLLATDGHPALDPLDLLRRVSRAVGPQTCLISVGGAATPRDIRRRLQAGASLVQVHAALRRTNRREWLGLANAGSSGHTDRRAAASIAKRQFYLR